ncbi:MAG: TolC family protein [Candidatus Omnitrophota bacterium]
MLIALKKRPEIKALEEKLVQDKANLNIAKANNKPQVSVGADYNFSNRSGFATIDRTSSGGFSFSKNYNDYWQGFVRINIPIFDGFQTKAKIDQAIGETKQTKLTQEKTNVEIQTQVKDSYLVLKNTNAKINTSQKDLEVASANYESIQERFQKGLVSSVEERSNNLTLSLAKFNYNEAIYDNFIAKAKLEKTIGQNI